MIKIMIVFAVKVWLKIGCILNKDRHNIVPDLLEKELSLLSSFVWWSTCGGFGSGSERAVREICSVRWSVTYADDVRCKLAPIGMPTKGYDWRMLNSIKLRTGDEIEFCPDEEETEDFLFRGCRICRIYYIEERV